MGEFISIEADKPLQAYMAKPTTTPKGAVMVIHEVWGVADHIQSVADRVAAEGYLALAPDFLVAGGIDVSPIITLQEALFDPARRNEVQPKLRQAMTPVFSPEFGQKTNERLQTCFEYLYALPEPAQKVAVMGFCFGGTYSYNLAILEPRLKLAVPFYGHCDHSVEELRNIKCPVVAFYGEKDENLMEQLPDLKQRMHEAGVNYMPTVYPNCGHAFFNDTNRFAYNAEAAKAAWAKTLEALTAALS